MSAIVQLPISQLSFLERNPRRISVDQMKKLQESIKEDPSFLSRRPILVNKVDDKNIIYAGNQRVKAAKKLGWKQVPCIVDENLSEEVIRGRIIKDNKTYGEFDYDILGNEWDIESLLKSGFTEQELCVDPIKEVTKEEEQEKEILEIFTRIGDVFELNENVIHCNSSSECDIIINHFIKHMTKNKKEFTITRNGQRV